MALWVARAGRHGENESYALSNNVVVVGWEDLSDLSSFTSRDALLASMLDTYPDGSPNAVKNWESQLWAFSKRFQVGDIVALPLKTQRDVAFGRIAGPYRYQPDAPSNAKHQRPVDWMATDIPRNKIDSDLRFSLGGAMTVFEVKRNNAEGADPGDAQGRCVPFACHASIARRRRHRCPGTRHRPCHSGDRPNHRLHRPEVPGTRPRPSRGQRIAGSGIHCCPYRSARRGWGRGHRGRARSYGLRGPAALCPGQIRR